MPVSRLSFSYWRKVPSESSHWREPSRIVTSRVYVHCSASGYSQPAMRPPSAFRLAVGGTSNRV